MSYIRAKRVDVEEGDISRDGRVSLELPDHGDAGSEMELDCNPDDEALGFVARLIDQVDELAEGEALVVWKVVF